MKTVFIFFLISPLFAGNNRSEQEFVINEPEKPQQQVRSIIPGAPVNRNPQPSGITVIQPDKVTRSGQQGGNQGLQRLDNTSGNNNNSRGNKFKGFFLIL